MDAQDFRSLSEAYIGVYDDDIREKLEFESWVNNLLEEGYDLSDYTWEEMYENYTQLDEVSNRRVAEVRKRRENVVSKAFDNYAGVSEKPGGTQQLATDISKLNRFKNLEKKRDRRINKESYDLYDMILSHLIDEGYADTQEAAERIMVNMSEDWRESIVETRMDPRGRPASGPMNVYANPTGKPSQARLDAIAAVEADNKKKTPEQRKKELDDYRERQMNNK